MVCEVSKPWSLDFLSVHEALFSAKQKTSHPKLFSGSYGAALHLRIRNQKFHQFHQNIAEGQAHHQWNRPRLLNQLPNHLLLTNSRVGGSQRLVLRYPGDKLCIQLSLGFWGPSSRWTTGSYVFDGNTWPSIPRSFLMSPLDCSRLKAAPLASSQENGWRNAITSRYANRAVAQRCRYCFVRRLFTLCESSQWRRYSETSNKNDPEGHKWDFLPLALPWLWLKRFYRNKSQACHRLWPFKISKWPHRLFHANLDHERRWKVGFGTSLDDLTRVESRYNWTTRQDSGFCCATVRY